MKLYRVNRSSGNAGPGPRHGWRPRSRALPIGAGGDANSVRDRVVQVLSVHRPGLDGWCEGCARDGLFTFHPCPSARWASLVAGRYVAARANEGER